MSRYRRRKVAGGTYFFTVVTEGRAPILCGDNARTILGAAIRVCQNSRPFDAVATVLLPDHFHAIWTLPDDDEDYSTRWSFIKSAFTRSWLAAGGEEQRIATESRNAHRRRGVWQRKFWEHHIRDEQDLSRHLDYIHYNPVKHGYVECPHDWPWSSFQTRIGRLLYEPTWYCRCDGRLVTPPDFSDMVGLELEGLS